MDELQHLDLVREFVQTAALAAVAQELECRRLLVDQLKVLLLAAHDAVEIGARVMGGGRRCRGQDDEEGKGQVATFHGEPPGGYHGADRASLMRDCKVSRSVAPRRICLPTTKPGVPVIRSASARARLRSMEASI